MNNYCNIHNLTMEKEQLFSSFYYRCPGCEPTPAEQGIRKEQIKPYKIIADDPLFQEAIDNKELELDDITISPILKFSRAFRGKTYYRINEFGTIFGFTEHDSVYSATQFNFGNYKQTEEQAKRHAIAIKAKHWLLNLADEYNEKHPLPKCHDTIFANEVYYIDVGVNNKFIVGDCTLHFSDKVYFSRECDAEAAIKRLPEDVKEYLLKGCQ